MLQTRGPGRPWNPLFYHFQFSPKDPSKIVAEYYFKTGQARAMPGVIDLVAISELKPGIIQPGAAVEGGRAMVDYIVRAVEMAMQGEIGAMVTSPSARYSCIRPDIFMMGIRN